MIHAAGVAIPVPSRALAGESDGADETPGGTDYHAPLRGRLWRSSRGRASADLQMYRKSSDFAKGPPPRMWKPFVAPPFQERPGMKTFYNVPEVCPVNCFARRARW